MKNKLKNFIKTKAIPRETRRRSLFYIFNIFLKHPIRFFKCFQPRKMKKLIHIKRHFGIQALPDNIMIQIQTHIPYDCKLTLIRRPKYFYKKFSLPKTNEPLVSIIVPAYNNFSYTYACLKSIAGNTTLPYEVIVADDCSTDKTKNISQIVKNVVHIRSDKNIHFLLNCNNAAHHAKGKYLFFLNNDTQIQPDCLESLVSLVEKDDSIGIVGSKLLYPNGILQDAGGLVLDDGTAMNIGKFDDSSKPEYNYVRDVDYITGAALLIRKNIWESIGGFDERYIPAYYEDTDLAFAVRELGYRTVMQPKSVVVHFEGITHGTDINGGVKQYQTINARKFHEKWKHVFGKTYRNNIQDISWVLRYGNSEKVALFFDHTVPLFDKSAGARNIFAYVKIFCELGYRVIFIADDFYAVQPYTDIFLQMGVPILYAPWHNQYNLSNWLHDYGKYIDFVYFHRPVVSYKYCDIIRETTNAKISYHVADIHHIRLLAQYEIEKDESLLTQANEIEAIERYLCTSSDILLTVSEKEKPILREIAPGKPVFVAPIFYYETFPVSKSFSNRRNIMFVGNFRHTPNINGILWFVNNVMPLLPNINLIIAGSKPPDSIKNLASDNITVTGYISDETLEEMYLSSRICIVPLQYGAGVKGKTVEAIYYQIPVVSTSNGVEGLPIDDLIPALDMPEDFANEIIKFLVSDEECEKAALEYSKWIQKWFSKERVMQITREILSV